MDLKSRTEDRTGELERTASELFEKQECPGASVAIVDGTETVFAAGYGDRQLEPQAPATPDTLYGIGSSTKPITATAVMTLVDDGVISLDDPVSSYVPYFQDAPGDPILVGELLSHTSGMPSDDVATHILLGEMADIDLDQSLDTWDAFREYVEKSVDRRLLDEDRCLYYNTGYVVLSRIIETTTGTSFSEYVETNVLEPLGMDESTFDVSVLEDDSRDAMTPYYEDDDEMQAVGLPDNPLFEAPGGLQAPVTDIAKFLGAWNERALPIDRDLAERMFEPVGTFRTLIDGSEIGYGYGWMRRPFGDDVLVGHGGGTGVSAGYLGFLEKRGLGIAIGCNAQPGTSPETLAMELLACATETDPAAVVPEQAIEQRQERVTGRYAAYGGMQDARVYRNDDYLEVEYSSPMGAETMQLVPTSLDPTEYTFRKVTSGATQTDVEFFVEEDGIRLLIARNLYERVGDLDDEDQHSGSEDEQ
jgi:CubicO group peptidase (beta-lactamase class C family)